MRARSSSWFVIAALSLGVIAPVMAQQSPAPPRAAQPQPPDQASLVELRLKDGSVIYGMVQSDTPDRVIVRTLAGVVVTVERAQIASLEPAHGTVVNGQFRRADANATRLLFSPTGRSLRKGEGYIGVYEFLLPFVQYGVTDRFSIGAGTPLVFFGDESGRPVWLTPKYQLHNGPNRSVAVGVMHFAVIGEDTTAGLAYAVATAGTADNAFTAGAGWAYARYHSNEYPPGACVPNAFGVASCVPVRTTKIVGSPVLMAGGEYRLSRGLKVITENYAFRGGGLISVGIRFLGEHLSADLGLFTPVSTEDDIFVLAPIVNFVWTFGK